MYRTELARLFEQEGIETRDTNLTDDGFEILVKTYFEPLVTKILPVVENFFKFDYPAFPNINFILRGGSALNYYFPSELAINTHDFDVGLVPWPLTPQSELINYELLAEKLEIIASETAQRLNLFVSEIASNPVTQNFKETFGRTEIIRQLFTLKFYSWKVGKALYCVGYNYVGNEGKLKEGNALIDFYIYGYNNNQPWINNRERNLRLNTNEIIEQAMMTNTFITDQIDKMVTDYKTKLNYVSLGTLLNDTVRMIQYSITAPNTPENQYRRNKSKRYIRKYILLLNEIDKLMPELKCDTSTINPVGVPQYSVILCEHDIIKRCDGSRSTNPQEDNQTLDEEIQSFYNIDVMNMLEPMPYNMKCAMRKVLTNEVNQPSVYRDINN